MNAKQTAEAATSADKKLPLFGRRHFVTLMLFLGMANAYVMRTNMSVAIVAMVKHPTPANNDTDDDNSSAAAECPGRPPIDHHEDGEFAWSSVEQGNLLAAFFYGYVLTQIPFALLTNMYGAMRFLGWGMMANSVFAFFVPMAARYGGFWSVFVMRFVQGLGEGPIVPCTHAMLANWIPIQERTRLCAFVYAGAQFGTIVSMPVSGLLASLDWTYVFYVSGVVSTVWSVAFLVLVDEDPSSDRWISEAERSFIEGERVPIMADKPKIPFRAIATSAPFYAILFAHIAQNYGYETLMTQLPTYMKSVLRFSIKENGFYSALPYLAMFIASMLLSWMADTMIGSGRYSIRLTRKILNTIGQWGPAVCLIGASFTGCNRVWTVALLTLGLGLNGGIYSGFKINHIDLTKRFAGLLMALTNCLANLGGLLAPVMTGFIIDGNPSIDRWRIVFCLAASVYIVFGTVYVLLASGERQYWDK